MLLAGIEVLTNDELFTVIDPFRLLGVSIVTFIVCTKLERVVLLMNEPLAGRVVFKLLLISTDDLVVFKLEDGAVELVAVRFLVMVVVSEEIVVAAVVFIGIEVLDTAVSLVLPGTDPLNRVALPRMPIVLLTNGAFVIIKDAFRSVGKSVDIFISCEALNVVILVTNEKFENTVLIVDVVRLPSISDKFQKGPFVSTGTVVELKIIVSVVFEDIVRFDSFASLR